MRKLSLLVGTLGGALAGYVLSNDKLRQELSKAKDAESAAKMLGAHLSKDGKKIAKEVKTFVDSDDVQKNLNKAKAYATEKFLEAKQKVTGMVAGNAKKAATSAEKSAKKVKRAAVKMERKEV